MQLEKVKAASVLSSAGEAEVKNDFLDNLQYRKRVEKAFESEKLAAVLLR